MPQYAFLLCSKDRRRIERRRGAEELGCAADVAPLGWLALFTTTSIATIGKAGAERLTLFAPVEAARANLARRREALEEVLAPPVAAHLRTLDEHLAKLPAGSAVQLWLSDLVFPWPASARPTLAARLRALDGREHEAWRDLLAEVGAGIEPDRIAGRFSPGVAVNACVGWLTGEPCPDGDP